MRRPEEARILVLIRILIIFLIVVFLLILLSTELQNRALLFSDKKIVITQRGSLTTDHGLRTTDGASRKNVTTFAEETGARKISAKEGCRICSRNNRGA
jgi:hypothetical protein